jgi:nitrogen fixation NifU-like protein
MMQEFYKEIVLGHCQRPRNQGELPDADIEEHINNPLCGDEVTVYANLRDGKVAEVRFTGRGCSISQASASMMTEQLLGKSFEEAEAEAERFKAMMAGKEGFPEAEDLAALKGVIKYPSRIKCATLAWTAFQKGLLESKKRNAPDLYLGGTSPRSSSAGHTDRTVAHG